MLIIMHGSYKRETKGFPDRTGASDEGRCLTERKAISQTEDGLQGPHEDCDSGSYKRETKWTF